MQRSKVHETIRGAAHLQVEYVHMRATLVLQKRHTPRKKRKTSRPKTGPKQKQQERTPSLVSTSSRAEGAVNSGKPFRVGSIGNPGQLEVGQNGKKRWSLCETQTGEVTMHKLLASAYTDRATGR